MSDKTLAQIVDALAELMGPLEFREWVLKETPSADQMRARLQEEKDKRTKRDKGFLHRWVTGMFG